MVIYSVVQRNFTFKQGSNKYYIYISIKIVYREMYYLFKSNII